MTIYVEMIFITTFSMEVIEIDCINEKILMCYGKTPFTPGSYLERAFLSVGVQVDVYTNDIDFSTIDLSNYLAVLFVESPSKRPITVKNIDLVHLPKVFWIHHGSNRLVKNVELCKSYKPDLILLSHSLHLAEKLPAPIHFFPFAMDQHIFNSSKPLNNRHFDISFVGGQKYSSRNLILNELSTKLKRKYKLSLFSNIYLEKLAELYQNSKIVFNHSPKKYKTINMRIFEGMGCGALVLTNQVPFQSRLFINDEHYVVYKTKKDLFAKINYYLKNLDEAQRIANKGHNYLLKNHTYEHRALELVNIFQNLKG